MSTVAEKQKISFAFASETAASGYFKLSLGDGPKTATIPYDAVRQGSRYCPCLPQVYCFTLGAGVTRIKASTVVAPLLAMLQLMKCAMGVCGSCNLQNVTTSRFSLGYGDCLQFNWIPKYMSTCSGI